MIGSPLEAASQPHVDQLGPALRSEDDIRGLDIAVNDAAAAGVHQSARDLQRDVDGLGYRQGPLRLDPLPHGRPLDVLEGDVVIHAVLADAEYPRDVLVVELRGGPSLLVESLDNFAVIRLIGRKQLQSDVALELGIERR